MRVSLNWLKDYVDIPMTAEELAHAFTMLGIGVETMERPGAGIENVFTGKILSIEPHPDADKLVVCRTDVGQEEPLQIVCGAKNMKAGDIVPTALIGAKLAGGFEIGRRKMRGIESQGMMCSGRELGISDDHQGLLIMPADTPIGVDARPLLGLDDVIMDLEITPNRGDWASVIGVARELAAATNARLRVPEIRITETADAAAKLSSVAIENSTLCPRYIGRVITGVKVGPSPEWLAQRLVAAGQRPINNVVDITNYVMLETGQPLHAFDYDLLKENRIVVRNPKPGETITTIDGQLRTLSPEMLIIADGEAPVAVAGVMGGLHSEVGDSTTRVFLESAWFNPVSIRRTARALGMQSEASARFQRGIDPETTLYAVNRAAMLLQEIADGQVAAGLLDAYPAPQAIADIRLRYKRTNQILGTDVQPSEQRRMLHNLGFAIAEENAETCMVKVPSWRQDCTREIDLIEEIARLYGYDKLASALPTVRPTEKGFAPKDAPVRNLRKLLTGYGLTEFYSWTFSNADEVRRCGLDASYLDMVALENPLSEKQATMRTSLIPGLLANASRNVRYGSTNILAFEIGPVYRPVAGAELPNEPVCLGVVFTGSRERHWSGGEQALGLYDIKGILESVLDHFGAAYALEEAETGTFLPGQCGRVTVDGQVLGWFGEARTAILRAYDIEQPVYLMELNLDPLLMQAAPVAQFKPIPGFPPSRRDMAVLVDVAVAAGSLCAAACETGGKILKSVDVFDVYTGKQVPQGKKSVALSLVFQSEERTLTDEDTQKTWERILRKLQTDFGAELR